MKFVNSVMILFFLFYFQMNALSYTRIYLMSEVEINKENLVLSDICKMEGDNIDKISNLIIPSGFYDDTIVDNKELYDFLSNNIKEQLFIFGSGVKIKKNIIPIESNLTKSILVEKGDMTELSIKKNGITIEIKGKALNSGCEQEEINFKLTTGKIVKGKITSLKKADVIL